jgi:hypothetical protein
MNPDQNPNPNFAMPPAVTPVPPAPAHVPEPAFAPSATPVAPVSVAPAAAPAPTVAAMPPAPPVSAPPAIPIAPPTFAPVPTPAPAAAQPSPSTMQSALPPEPRPAAGARAAVPLFSTTASVPVAPASRGGHSLAVLSVLAIVILACLGGGYVWAYRGAESTLPAADAILLDAKTVHFNLDTDVTATLEDQEYAFTLGVSGDIDRADDPGNPRVALDLDAELDGMLIAGELRLLDETLYARATKVPGAALSGDPSLEDLVGQWFSLTEAELEDATGEAAGIAGGEEDVALQELVDAGALSFTGPSIEVADGELVRVYEADADVAAALDVALGLARDAAESPEALEAIDAYAPVLRELARGLSVDDLQFRVALLSGELRAASGVVRFDAANIDQDALNAAIAASGEGAAAEEEIPEARLTVAFDVTYSGYDEPVSIQAPVDAKPLTDFFGTGDAALETVPAGSEEPLPEDPSAI